MKKVLLYSVLLCLVGVNAHGATPSEQLKQLIVQLQSNPGAAALREKIIKLARTMKPVPAVPAEAERFDGRGEYAFKEAKNEADFLAAANEFVKASNVAPWVASFYFNAATAFEKGQKPADAKRNFELYLLAAPDAKDAREVRRRIAGLEFAIEKANSPEAQASRKREQDEATLRSADGARFVNRSAPPGVQMEEIFEINGTRLIITHRLISIDRRQILEISGMRNPGESRHIDTFHWSNGRFVRTDLPESVQRDLGYCISTDMRELFQCTADGKTGFRYPRI